MSTEAASDVEKRTKIVKRYSNRKLYDTDRSRYVTLDEIARMIKAGDEVAIIDNESKEDLTGVTLTQIIYEEEKRESRMPLGMLRNLIQSGGSTLQDFYDRQVKAPVGQMRDNAQKSVEELRQSAAQIREAATRSVNELTDSARRIFSREERKAEEFRRAMIQLFDAMEDRIEARIEDVVHAYDALADQAADPRIENPSTDRAREAIQTEAHVGVIRERLEAIGALATKLDHTLDSAEAKVRAAATPSSAPNPSSPPPPTSD